MKWFWLALGYIALFAVWVELSEIKHQQEMEQTQWQAS